MARPLRIEFPGAFYHVMNRGITGMTIFKSEGDREKFLEYVGKAVALYNIKVHSYCLMNTHYHFLIETPHPNLGQAMQWINSAYSMYFNKKRKRVGHLFQGRYKAVLVNAHEYLLNLSRYIHLNPVRARLVEHCKDYPWSSYPVFSGYVESPDWLETDWLLSILAKDADKAKRKYRKFIESAQNKKIVNPSDDVVGGVILGNLDFVDWVKKTFLCKDCDYKAISQLKKLKPRPQLEHLIQAVAEEFTCGPGAILQKGKKRNLARDVAIYLCREISGETGTHLGKYFGGITGAGITMKHGQIAKQMETDGMLQKRLDIIRKKIFNI